MSLNKKKYAVQDPKGINSISTREVYFSGFRCRKEHETADFLKNQFKQFVRDWAEETSMMSSTSQIRKNDNYVRLLRLGKSLIPLILSEIKQGNNDVRWALLLTDIIGFNPAPPEFSGNFDLIHGYLVSWGEKNSYI